MKTFTNIITESKKFLPDPSVLKMVAYRLLPLYLEGIETYNESYMDEFLESLKSRNKEKNLMNLYDLELNLLKLFVNDPLQESEYKKIMDDMENNFIKLDRFIFDKRKAFYKK